MKPFWKAAMGGTPPAKDEDEEDWDDTDPTTTGISMDEWAKENMKGGKSPPPDLGYIPRSDNFKPAPKDGQFDPTKKTRIILPKKEKPASIDYNMRNWSDTDRGPDYFAASSDKAFTYAWSIVKQIS